MTFPFSMESTPDTRGLRLAALHLATHTLDQPAAPPEPETTGSGLLVVSTTPAEQRFTDVLAGAARYMEFIDRQGSVSAHTVALEEIRDLIAEPGFSSDTLLRMRSIINGAMGGGQ